MQELGPAEAPLSEEQLIELCESKVKDVMRNVSSEEDSDRCWLLYKNFNNYLYSRGLQNSAPQLVSSIMQMTNAGWGDGQDDSWAGMFDFTQKHYTGFKRKFEAVIGNRMPNAIAVPNNASDEEGIKSVKSANPAAIYIREQCELEAKHLAQAGRHFDFGTTFWHMEWVEDGDKYGYREEPITTDEQGNPLTEQKPLGDAGFSCPQCGAKIPSDSNEPEAAPETCPQCGGPLSMDNFTPPTMTEMPSQNGTTKVPNGGFEITLLDSNQVAVPLGSKAIEDCDRLRWEREIPKGRLLKKYPQLRKEKFADASEFDNNASELGVFIRSAMTSPLGMVRTNRSNQWTCVDEWWTPNEYELIEDDEVRSALQKERPTGARFVFVKGKMMEIKSENLIAQWQECKPEPLEFIMTDALGDEWTETTDIANNTTNQELEHLVRSNLPIFVNAQKVDIDAYQSRRSSPMELFPILPRAGRALSDEIAVTSPPQYSEQIPEFRTTTMQYAQDNTGLIPQIWGGGEADPTARQTLLKTNQALMQLGLFWTQIRKSLEKVLLKSCKILSEHMDGIIQFSKKSQFGGFNTVAFDAAALRSDSYHFEADEAIPVNWGQQRDQLMWMLSQGAENPDLLNMMGLNDPFNIFEIKQLLGVPGMRVPNFDAREKGMGVIAQLVQTGPMPAAPGPDGSPGEAQPSIQPDWEDDPAFMSSLAKAFLVENSELKTDSPDGYANVQAWGKAYEKLASPPAAPAPPKTTVSFAAKASDVGPQATQAILVQEGIVPNGTPVAPVAPPLDPNKAQPLMNGAPMPPTEPQAPPTQ